MQSLYRVTFAIVTIFVAVFSVVNMSGEAFFARANSQPLSSLPSHFRWGTGGNVTVGQYYKTRDQVGNLTGIDKVELRSQTLAYTSMLQQALVDVYAAPNRSVVYSGLTNFSGATTPGPGQVIVIRNSLGSSSLSIGQVIQANFSFYAGAVAGSTNHVSMDRNLTVAGFADATANGFGYLTNSEIGNPSGNLFDFTTLIANWDDLIPPLINFANSNKAQPFFTGLFVYVKASDFNGPDPGVELARAQSLQGQIQSITSSIGGSVDSWLIDQLQEEVGREQSWVYYAMGIAIATGAVAVILSVPIIERVATNSIEAYRSRDSKTDSSKNACRSSSPKHEFNLRTLAAGTIGIGLGILISIPVVSILVYSSVFVSTLTVETLFFNTVFGVALATVIWLQSREEIGSSIQPL